LGAGSVAEDCVASPATIDDLAARLPALKIVACPGLGGRANNPYTWLTHEPMSRLGGATVSEFSFYRPLPPETQILHVHWPERIFWGRVSRLHPLVSALFARRMLSAADAVRRRGGFLVWTAHNITPHEPFDKARNAIWQEYFPAFRSRVDLVVSLSSWAQQELIAAYPDLIGRRSVVIPHPHYRTAYPAPPAQAEARCACGLPEGKFILLAAGTVRPSKGIAELAGQFCQIARPDERLIIAGACGDSSMLAELNRVASESRGAVEWRPGHLGDADLPLLIAAADLSVFNFRTILNSGSLIASLSFNTPVCAPELGSLKELSATLGPRWFLPMPRPLTPEALRAAIDRAREGRQAGEPPEVAPLDALAPEGIAFHLCREYAALLESKGRI
jgi:glycosyltransferase involved in cell wall biosynthesis